MDFIQSTTGGLIMAAGGLFVYLLLLLWALRPHQNQRWLLVISATFLGVLVFLANKIAHAMGWWEWWGYSLPFIVQLGLLLILPSLFFTFLLLGYRWLVLHSQRPHLWYALIGILVLVPLTVFGDLYNIKRGKLAFGEGYNIWQDVLVGQLFFWFPVLLYRLVQQRVRQIPL